VLFRPGALSPFFQRYEESAAIRVGHNLNLSDGFFVAAKPCWETARPQMPTRSISGS
jgi:hypothetical protein